jgi:hypothetical protein
MTGYLEGSCSIQLSYGVKGQQCVGVAGFEPTTSWSQTRRDTGLRYTPNTKRVITRSFFSFSFRNNYRDKLAVAAGLIRLIGTKVRYSRYTGNFWLSISFTYPKCRSARPT